MKTLKKIAAFALIAMMICVFASAAVSADEGMPFWLTHFNNNTVEGSGVIFTQPYDGAVWWIHVSFKPVEGYTNVYEIVNMSDGTPDGSGVAQNIPEGGFVYASNYGNDYISLGMGSTDYTSASCSDMIHEVQTWNVGDRIVLHGVDLEGLSVPTSTPDINWYDDEYVCTATFDYFNGSNGEPVEEDNTSTEEPEESEDTASEASETDEESPVPEEESAPVEESTPADDSAEESAESTSKNGEGGLSTGAIIGIIAAVAVVVCVIIFVIVKKKKK